LLCVIEISVGHAAALEAEEANQSQTHTQFEDTPTLSTKNKKANLDDNAGDEAHLIAELDELTRDDNKSLPSAPKLSSARPSESELTAAMGLDFGDESFPTSTPEPLKPVIATAPVRPKAPSPNITTISSQSLASPATQPKADPKSVPTPKTMEKTVLAAKK